MVKFKFKENRHTFFDSTSLFRFFVWLTLGILSSTVIGERKKFVTRNSVFKSLRNRRKKNCRSSLCETKSISTSSNDSTSTKIMRISIQISISHSFIFIFNFHFLVCYAVCFIFAATFCPVAFNFEIPALTSLCHHAMPSTVHYHHLRSPCSYLPLQRQEQ